MRRAALTLAVLLLGGACAPQTRPVARQFPQLALGLVGKPSSGWGTLTGQGNGQGGREHGQKADQLPGYRSISDPAARRHLARVWEVPEESIPGAGLPAAEMLATLGYIGGLLCLGGAAVIILLWEAPTSYRIVCLWAGLFFFAGAGSILAVEVGGLPAIGGKQEPAAVGGPGGVGGVGGMKGEPGGDPRGEIHAV